MRKIVPFIIEGKIKLNVSQKVAIVSKGMDQSAKE